MRGVRLFIRAYNHVSYTHHNWPNCPCHWDQGHSCPFLISRLTGIHLLKQHLTSLMDPQHHYCRLISDRRKTNMLMENVSSRQKWQMYVWSNKLYYWDSLRHNTNDDTPFMGGLFKIRRGMQMSDYSWYTMSRHQGVKVHTCTCDNSSEWTNSYYIVYHIMVGPVSL